MITDLSTPDHPRPQRTLTFKEILSPLDQAFSKGLWLRLATVLIKIQKARTRKAIQTGHGAKHKSKLGITNKNQGPTTSLLDTGLTPHHQEDGTPLVHLQGGLVIQVCHQEEGLPLQACLQDDRANLTVGIREELSIRGKNSFTG